MVLVKCCVTVLSSSFFPVFDSVRCSYNINAIDSTEQLPIILSYASASKCFLLFNFHPTFCSLFYLCGLVIENWPVIILW